MTTTEQNSRIEIGASDLLDLLTGAIIASGQYTRLRAAKSQKGATWYAVGA